MTIFGYYSAEPFTRLAARTPAFHDPLAMSHFAQKVPTSPTRHTELHDQSQMPASPHKTRADRMRLATLVILGVAFALAFTAMGVQIRVGWESHRDWVIPVIAQGAAIGGVAAAYLVIRGRDAEFAIGTLFLVLCGVVMGMNYLRGAETEGPDTLRDWLSVISGVLYGLSMLAFIAGWLSAELRDPTRPKAPEL